MENSGTRDIIIQKILGLTEDTQSFRISEKQRKEQLDSLGKCLQNRLDEELIEDLIYVAKLAGRLEERLSEWD